ALKVRQILFNLLSNAAKFTEQGMVALSCSREPGERMVFRVRDNGIGISAESLEVLFKPFSQADASTTRRYGGTGLGLAISRSYARMLGGDIEVESAPGQGSTFTVDLPVHMEGPEELPKPEHPPVAQAEGRPAQTELLLIDDDEAVHNI